jgi:hypothetical protein
MKLGGKSERTKELRSETPVGFARAFFLANQMKEMDYDELQWDTAEMRWM